METPISRNTPPPMAETSVPQSTPLQTLDEACEKAIAYHLAGQLDAAEKVYRAILQAEPRHPAANHFLGMLAVGLQQPEAALPNLLAALEAKPEMADYWLAYIDALLQAGQADAARQVLELGRQHGLQGKTFEDLAARLTLAQPKLPPNSPPTSPTKRPKSAKSTSRKSKRPTPEEEASLASLFAQGRYGEGVVLARAMTERFPQHGFGWKLLGALLSSQGNSAEALEPMQTAALLSPLDEHAQTNLGLVLAKLNRLPEAEAFHRRALTINPEFAGAHNNLGSTLESLGRLADAECSYRKAIDLHPEYAEAYNNLAVAVKKQGRPLEAEVLLRRALEYSPDLARVHYNLANTLQELGRYDEAEVACRRALQIAPDFAEALNNLGYTLMDMGRLDEAEASFRRALEVDPKHPGAQTNVLFCVDYHPDLSPQEIYRAYQEHDRRYGLPLRSTWRDHENNADPGRRLRVAYVSPDFRFHACHLYVEPLLARHDKTQVEVFAYAELSREDQVTARYKGYVEHWIPTKGMSDDALADRIRSDGIDILVDVAGHTAGNRLPVFSRKPAPVSVSWLIGSGYTTGLSAIDYFLADRVLVPAGSDRFFAEQPWRISTPAFSYRPNEGMGEVNDLPALANGYPTFGVLTRSIRINHRTIRVWSELLNRLPDARLIIDSFSYQDPAMQTRLATAFAAHGISPTRLQIGHAYDNPWEALRNIDISLDCFPNNIGTSLLVSLYMGVPTVTLAGRASLGLFGSHNLRSTGHPEWIAGSEEEYLAKAVALASDLDRLATCRRSLRAEMERSPLLDEAGFARKVEEAYRQMWQKWCGQQSRKTDYP